MKIVFYAYSFVKYAQLLTWMSEISQIVSFKMRNLCLEIITKSAIEKNRKIYCNNNIDWYANSF